MNMKITERLSGVTDVGIAGLDTVSEEQFFAIGEKLAEFEHGLQWAIGDWYNSIPAGKGNQYSGTDGKAAACERVGLHPKTAKECGRVARTFARADRAAVASFKHHYVLVHEDLTANDAKRLLKRAIEGDEVTDKKTGEVVSKPWSSAKLRKERDIFLGIIERHPTQEFDTEVNALQGAVEKELPASVPAKVKKQVVKTLERIALNLKHQYSKDVEREAEAKARVARENMKKAQQRADEQYEKALKLSAGVKAFLTREEFMLIRSCLHPDREATPERKRKAFDVFNKLADVKDW